MFFIVGGLRLRSNCGDARHLKNLLDFNVKRSAGRAKRSLRLCFNLLDLFVLIIVSKFVFNVHRLHLHLLLLLLLHNFLLLHSFLLLPNLLFLSLQHHYLLLHNLLLLQLPFQLLLLFL